MNTQQKLDESSPIVQRVLRLRERLARNESEKLLTSVDTTQAEQSYPWQMWQKSDFSAYVGGGSVHKCKE